MLVETEAVCNIISGVLNICPSEKSWFDSASPVQKDSTLTTSQYSTMKKEHEET